MTVKPEPDFVTKVRDQRAALKAYDDGIPSTLPDTNRFKYLVEAHRWGRHGERPLVYVCPVCARAKREGG